MVLGALGKLTSGAARNLARNLFSGFWERGLSANQALTALREQGLGYRRQDFLSDYSQGAAHYKQAVSIRNVNLDKVPSERILESQYHGVPDRYSILYKSTGIDSSTGEEREQYFFIHRNTLASRRSMENDAYNWMSEQASTYGYEIEDIQVAAAYINPVWE